ncbi:MAG: hypothetical protein PHD97_10590, partial [Bacteroidales bacterium]|nr:hypothetical protein [Bacteroidales bacterium]
MKNLKYIFLLLVVFFQTLKSAAINYTWIGIENSVWSNANNWLPIGIPDTADKVIIVFAVNNPVLDGNKTIKYFEISGGTVDLNGYILEITNEGKFISGNINNGNIICNNADKIEFGDSLNGPVIGVGIIAYAENIFISNTTFGSDVVLVKTGGSPNECEGGNIFNAKTIIRNLSSY